MNYTLNHLIEEAKEDMRRAERRLNMLTSLRYHTPDKPSAQVTSRLKSRFQHSCLAPAPCDCENCETLRAQKSWASWERGV